MRNLIVACILLYCGAAVSASIESPLECKSEAGSEGSVTLSSKDKIFLIKSSERGCGSEYTYKNFSGEAKGLLVTSFPGGDELGINAQNMIYFVPLGSKDAIYVGSIPASSTELEDGTYQNIVQSGGSIYKNIYKIESDKIDILSPSFELIVSDTQCVYQSESGEACKKISGTFEKPICVINYGERKVISDLIKCSGMTE
jgi:hypothetical protein